MLQVSLIKIWVTLCRMTSNSSFAKALCRFHRTSNCDSLPPRTVGEGCPKRNTFLSRGEGSGVHNMCGPVIVPQCSAWSILVRAISHVSGKNSESTFWKTQHRCCLASYLPVLPQNPSAWTFCLSYKALLRNLADNSEADPHSGVLNRRFLHQENPSKQPDIIDRYK